jgi:hypothetical protein
MSRRFIVAMLGSPNGGPNPVVHRTDTEHQIFASTASMSKLSPPRTSPFPD